MYIDRNRRASRMASVTIDIGSGKRATLSNNGEVSRSAEQRAAVSELMLHWSKYSGLLTGAVGYLRDLGLAGSLSGNPVAALRSAIEDGRVSVSIDRPTAHGEAAGGSPSPPPFPKASRLASVPASAGLPIDKPLPSWATPSDVSAGELIAICKALSESAALPVPLNSQEVRISLTLPHSVTHLRSIIQRTPWATRFKLQESTEAI